jgi:hypothetical protein
LSHDGRPVKKSTKSMWTVLSDHFHLQTVIECCYNVAMCLYWNFICFTSCGSYSIELHIFPACPSTSLQTLLVLQRKKVFTFLRKSLHKRL